MKCNVQDYKTSWKFPEDTTGVDVSYYWPVTIIQNPKNIEDGKHAA